MMIVFSATRHRREITNEGGAMKEIEVRAWDDKTKTMYYSHNCGKHPGYVYLLHGEWEIETADKNGDHGACFPADNLMLWTGLKDKNVWESDIISDNVGIGVVEYSEKHAAFRINYKNGQCKWFHDYLDSEMKTLEVIGNIYGEGKLLN